jgi:outer membrane receptor protein involved in Fe transport
LVDRLDANLGARVSRTITEDEASELEGLRAVRTSQITLTPSLSLSWSPRAGKLVFLRYARALRPGGLVPGVNAPAARFQSDKLDSLDLGTRLWLADSRLAVDASLFFTNWGDIQSDFLLPNGLVSTRNAGRGRIVGAEASAEWRVDDALTLFGGFSAQSALLVRNAQGIKLHDRRLPVVPDLTARLGLSHVVSLGGWRGKAAIQANYLGHARLTFDEDLDRQMGGYATVSSFLSLARGHWTLAAQVENLLDIKGDSFAFGNPFSIRLAPQYTPLRPRSLTLSIRRDW